MEQRIVDVENVSIKFNLSSEKIDSMKDYLVKRLKGQISFDEFWALQDISFSMNRGDSVALIGLNGCGKSTLLKTIAGVLKPTKGSVKVYGSIAPLIELGAGFDHDLTAEENIYLNGAILGYGRQEMQKHYEDIVEFSELRDFMNVPIKNFSSGMLARLAFSIATIGNPDLLIVDEVLSVGDFRFQEKCERRIQNMMKEDTSILFVSHSIEQVQKLCKRAIWIEKGHIVKAGTTEEVCPEFRTWPAEIYDNNIDSTLYTNVGELTEGSKVSQQFTCTQNGLNSLELTMSNLGQECEAEYAWTLTETESEKVVAKGEFTAGEVDNSKNMVLKLSELEESKGKQYVLTIETESIKSEHGVTAMTTDRSLNEDGKLSINGKESLQVLVMKEQMKYFNTETFIVLLGLIAYLVFLITFLNRLFK